MAGRQIQFGRQEQRILPPVNVRQQMLLPSSEKLIGELPSILGGLLESVGVELPDEAGEVIVFEELGEEVTGEFRGAPDDKSGAIMVPRDDMISGRVIDKVEGLDKERGRARSRRRHRRR